MNIYSYALTKSQFIISQLQQSLNKTYKKQHQLSSKSTPYLENNIKLADSKELLNETKV